MTSRILYEIENYKFTPDAPNFALILQSAYEKKKRPSCLCCDARPELYIAHMGDQYILKRMPGTGHLHAPSCPTFDPPPELSGLGHLEGSAIQNDEDGETHLKLGFPLSVRGNPKPAEDPKGEDGEEESQPRSPSSSVKAADRKLSLLATLHYLWDAAELTKHRPSWTGKRSWYVVRRELMSVVSRSALKAKALASILYIPPHFNVEKKDAITAARNQFMHGLRPVKGKPTQLGVVIGIFKKIEPSMYGARVTLKHMPDFPFYMDEATNRKFEKAFVNKIRMVDEQEGGQLIIIATFSVSEGHGVIREIAAMMVSPQWLPYDTHRERQIMAQIENRTFIKCLRYNLGPTAAVASFLLLDTDAPVALYCPNDFNEEEAAARYEAIVASGSYAGWIWWADSFEMPRIPEAYTPAGAN